ncbi:MAG: S-adenosylmethionine:tRNA ribosyltransferase-isomerase [Bacteroidetes bacterium]|nr:S-adenosylmethionine:tRNA ribosyltransferase-isomerase [Bacteroidota bacterium]
MQESARNLRMDAFQYELPENRIAKYPLAERDCSKLLIYKQANIESDFYYQIDRHLPEGALMVFNDTRVIPARLQFVKDSGGGVEVFCLEPVEEQARALAQQGTSVWNCLIGGAKKWKSGPMVLENDTIRLEAHWEDRGNNQIRFQWTPQSWSFAAVLEALGSVPLPPYLARPAEPDDRIRYQTIFARYEGSVAAPTAGLHFTDRIFQQLAQKNIEHTYLTLHVGAGTFKPVKSETIGDHDMHAEYFDVSLNGIKRLLEQYRKGAVIAVGTTTLRTLESLFLMGSKLVHQPGLELAQLEIKQWDAYAPEHAQTTVFQSFETLLHWMESRQMDRIIAKTQLMIAPGYRVRTIQALVTNFHQPGSTLLLLVAALVGDDWKRIYQFALENEYRFLSYGDGSILYCANPESL